MRQPTQLSPLHTQAAEAALRVVARYCPVYVSQVPISEVAQAIADFGYGPGEAVKPMSPDHPDFMIEQCRIDARKLLCGPEEHLVTVLQNYARVEAKLKALQRAGEPRSETVESEPEAAARVEWED